MERPFIASSELDLDGLILRGNQHVLLDFGTRAVEIGLHVSFFAFAQDF
jgi:hypothetical protein